MSSTQTNSNVPSAAKKIVKRVIKKTKPVDDVTSVPVDVTPDQNLENVPATPATPVTRVPVVEAVNDSTTNDTFDTNNSINTVQSDGIDLEKHFESLLADIETIRIIQKRMMINMRTTKKTVMKQARDLKKNRNRRNVSGEGSAPRKPSGFAQPALISNELCDFLKVPRGIEMARTDVTKKVIAYVKDHELEIRGNKRNIEPDAALERLVGTAEDRQNRMQIRRQTKPMTTVTDALTYFNIQTHLNPHFIRKSQRESESESATVSV
ncbi:hypothetical protein BDK51DRAFT_30051 [Blyttiomyces helicus]|uniref:DM2 domain-containing protein n=1 Tax=Blyttiomyces helicus TaxID=388810 RepID=A0A4P9WPX5_9FUNG|nr:hypothetical protein BDK51DRAFT_30051 [Blyttiomyces helicus]|eukprot:RKO94395.1 hypothetical protein BDK51DRAFT_30051 [Blyttiomyces helicus]